MALTAGQIQARIDSIQTAIASGVLIARHGDTSTQFRDLDDMNSILAQLQAQLADAQGVTRKRRVSYVKQSTKGYGCGPGNDGIG